MPAGYAQQVITTKNGGHPMDIETGIGPDNGRLEVLVEFNHDTSLFIAFREKDPVFADGNGRDCICGLIP
jgi:hypothetical protein